MTCCPCDTVLPDLRFLIRKMGVTVFRLPGPGYTVMRLGRERVGTGTSRAA